MIIHGKPKDLGGGFVVSRYLPTVQCRSVGPFIFLDQMGPVTIHPTTKLDVRPHPHIGLATVTYLLSGVGLHRDSIGSVQVIRPGDVNYMTSGRGIVHSERTPSDMLSAQNEGHILHGLQFWVALPKDEEDCEPAFDHYSSTQLPVLQLNSGITCKVLIGRAHLSRSPVQTKFKTLFLDYAFSTEASIDLNLTQDFENLQLGLLCLSGSLKVEGSELPEHSFYFTENPRIKVTGDAKTRFIVFGGEQLPEARHMWWNFVSTSKERIRQAAKDWQNDSFPKVPGETEFIPLPNDPLP